MCNVRPALVLLAVVSAGCVGSFDANGNSDGFIPRADGGVVLTSDGGALLLDQGGTSVDSSTPRDPNDPFPAMPAQNVWPTGTSSQTMPSGLPLNVSVPTGDTSDAILIIGSWNSAGVMQTSDRAIVVSIQSDGAFGGSSCPGAYAAAAHVPETQFIEVVQNIGYYVRFNHRRVFLGGDGYTVNAGLSATLQPYLAGVYVFQGDYNNVLCKNVTASPNASFPKLYFSLPSSCDDLFCPTLSCVKKVRGYGYDVTFNPAFSESSCNCNNTCKGDIARPHTKGWGSAANVRSWLIGISR